jgi:peptidoglycan/LPS O-acetylase OafA/YrhL
MTYHIEATAKTARIPSLDGLRALSIAAVVLGHGSGTHGFPEWLTELLRNGYIDIANLGVRIFFVISGFLITGLLRDELVRSDAINLRRFFFRRTFRIVPAYVAFLTIVWLLSGVGVTDVTGRDLLHAATYTTNYFVERSWDVGHLWSLAVEEQFYLLWPLTFGVLGIVSGRRVLLGVALVIPVWRVAQSMLLPELRPLIGSSFETTADALAIGCLLSLFKDELLARDRVRQLLRSTWLVPILLLVGIAASARHRPALLVGIPILNVAVAALVARAVFLSDGTLGRLLNQRGLAFLGTLSYSLYLWQQVFMNRNSSQWWTAFPQNLLLAFVAALLSYRLVEKPCLQWREQIEKRLFRTPQPSNR